MLPILLTLLVMSGNPLSEYSGLVWYHSDGCGACSQMKPTIDKLILEGLPIIVVKVEFTQQAFKEQEITKVPATKTYQNGNYSYLDYGVLDEKKLRSMIGISKEKKKPITECCPGGTCLPRAVQPVLQGNK